jgi:hypothetical protein
LWHRLTSLRPPLAMPLTHRRFARRREWKKKHYEEDWADFEGVSQRQVTLRFPILCPHWKGIIRPAALTCGACSRGPSAAVPLGHCG